ncbi:family 78 glycoside hydrolase catalytic domain [Termitidicoccus mucosus]|uniref:Alpha-L-rhamnosidase six-hairpin glycosidase domain-containing protein n=1 Tax=Termitidicoccus mucosus TaxID=1184151 RepID=A0A178IL18_9BACT|nr:hypothetical protein AW736_10845 [Opitutaceae bacterium TSB47]
MPISQVAPTSLLCFRLPSVVDSSALPPAKWIWSQGGASAGQPQFCRFTTAFEWEGGPVEFYVTADQRFVLSINGGIVARGPDAGAPERYYYSGYRVDLPPGRHEWSALVWWLGDLAPYAHVSQRPAFLLAAEGAAHPLLTTGIASWIASHCAEFIPVIERKLPGAHFIGPSYLIDGALAGEGEASAAVPVADARPEGVNGRLPVQWVLQPSELPEQIHSEWSHWKARAEGGEWMADNGKMRKEWILGGERSLAMELAEGNEVVIEAHREWTALLDAETIITAYPGIETSGGRGARIDLSWAESLGEAAELKENNFLVEKGHRDEIAGKFFYGFGDTFAPAGSGGVEFLQVPWWRAGRYLLVRVRTADHPLVIRRLACEQTGYPVRSRSRFECPDDTLGKVLSLCDRGIRASCHEMYSDCPAFEQLMYAGDARVEALVHRCLETDDRLARKAIQVFNDSRHKGGGWTWSRYPARVGQVLPVFSLIWVLMVDDFLHWRDDAAFIKSQLTGVRATLDIFEDFLDGDGWLRGLPGWHFVDWCPHWQNGVPPSDASGRRALVNLFYVLALQAGARIEDAVGAPARAGYLRTLADKAGAAVRMGCSADDGLFRDAPGVDSLSEHTQALAALALLKNRQEKRALLETTRRVAAETHKIAPASYYFMHYLFEACHEAASDWLHDRLSPWRDLLARGLRTPIEAAEPCRSDCHGWASHPLFHAYATIAGIRPGSAGFSSVIVEPLPGRLPGLEADFPWRAASISLKLGFAGGSVRGEVSLPNGLSGEFRWAGMSYPIRPGLNVIKY